MEVLLFKGLAHSLLAKEGRPLDGPFQKTVGKYDVGTVAISTLKVKGEKWSRTSFIPVTNTGRNFRLRDYLTAPNLRLSARLWVKQFFDPVDRFSLQVPSRRDYVSLILLAGTHNSLKKQPCS